MHPMVGPKRPLTQWLYRTFSECAAVFASMARVNPRRALLAVLAACALMPTSASAFPAAEGHAAADRAAIAWARDHQQRDGAFVDYVSHRPTYGYSGVMIGYG